LLSDGVKYFKNLEKLVGMYGSNGFSVGSSLTWADISIFELVVSWGSQLPNFEKDFPLVHGVHQSVGNHDKLKTYIASRPVTKF
jgi:hypothetical protein